MGQREAGSGSAGVRACENSNLTLFVSLRETTAEKEGRRAGPQERASRAEERERREQVKRRAEHGSDALFPFFSSILLLLLLPFTFTHIHIHSHTLSFSKYPFTPHDCQAQTRCVSEIRRENAGSHWL